MDKNINIRKRLDEMQSKTNELLLSYFNEIQGGKAQSQGLNTELKFSSPSKGMMKIGEEQTNQQQWNQGIVRDQQAAISLINTVAPIAQPKLPSMNTLSQVAFEPNFKNTSNLRSNVEDSLRHNNQTPNSLGQILNVLTKEHLKNSQSTPYWVPN